MVMPPTDMRSYKNVTVHYSKGHKVGKIYMTGNAHTNAPDFMSYMQSVISKPSKVLICTHMDVEPLLGKYEGYETAHWGAIDGKNDWNGCNVAVIYGLQHLDAFTPGMTLSAIERWLRYKFPKHKRDNILDSLSVGHQITCLVQAINRVQCRVCTNPDNGDCDKTDVYILLPDWKRGKQILDGIAAQMPGVVLKEWDAIKVPRRAVRRSGYEPKLVNYLSQLTADVSVPATEIRRIYSIPSTTFDRLCKKAKDTRSQLYNDLARIGVSLHMPANGKGGRGHSSYFLKI